MSAEQLKLNHDIDTSWLIVDKLDNNKLLISVKNPEDEVAETIIDCGQAHLLMLYLQEYLREVDRQIKDINKMWYCPRCDKYHKADYDCTIYLHEHLK